MSLPAFGPLPFALSRSRASARCAAPAAMRTSERITRQQTERESYSDYRLLGFVPLRSLYKASDAVGRAAARFRRASG